MTNKEELEKYSYSLFKKINSNYQSEKDYHLETLSRIFSEDFKKETIRKYASYLKDNKGYQEYFNKKNSYLRSYKRSYIFPLPDL